MPHSRRLAHASRAARIGFGKTLRRRLPRSTQGELTLVRHRDPLQLLARTDVGRIAGLLPIRYERMVQSPFAFLRGAAAVMAFDLAQGPVTGLHVQACGDCHLLNFGAFATPERRVIFDINDFDETLPAPWEWDIKRLAASILVAGRYRGFAERHCAEATLAAVRAYRENLAEYATWPRLLVWYARIDAGRVVEIAGGTNPTHPLARNRLRSAATMSARLLPKFIEVVRGSRRIRDEPPLIYHPRRAAAFVQAVRTAIHDYRRNLPADRRALVERYEVMDAAVKVVGVGSVGTFCAVALLEADADDPLFLQIKQARPSVLEPYVARSAFRNQAERVVVGQRLMQSASDLFLGWSRIGKPPLDVYFRQLRDMKVSLNLDLVSVAGFIDYARHCGWAVARAHAKTGDAATISGYLGRGEAFDKALMRFAGAYADQTELDHAGLVRAVRAGRVAVAR